MISLSIAEVSQVPPPCHAYIYTTNNTDQVLNRELSSLTSKAARTIRCVI